MNSSVNQLKVPVSASDHIRGPENAAVTIVEYADYQCPYCGKAYRVDQQVLPRLKDVRLVFRNFPLTQLHPYAELAAEAAESAGAQGKFWEMHDMLFEHQDALSGDDIVSYAEELGLDMDRFVSDVNNHRFVEKIRADVQGGIESGVNGTPAFFINGRFYNGSMDPDQLMHAIREAGGGN